MKTAKILFIILIMIIAPLLSCGNMIEKGIESFQTPVKYAPSAAGLYSPSNVSVIGTVTPAFKWNAADIAAEYRLEISENSTFLEYAVLQEGITDVEYPLTDEQQLTPEQAYYWRVFAISNEGVESVSSEVFLFRVDVNTPVVEVTADKTSLYPDEFFTLTFKTNEKGTYIISKSQTADFSDEFIFKIGVIDDNLINTNISSVYSGADLYADSLNYLRVKVIDDAENTGSDIVTITAAAYYVDSVPVSVVTTSPDSDELDVIYSTENITVSFENPEDPLDLDLNVNTLPGCLTCDNGLTVGLPQWDFQTETAVFPIDAELSREIEEYNCTISGIQDFTGNTTPDYNWTFHSRDATPPTVSLTTPGSGNVDGAIGKDYHLSEIAIQFSEPMDTASLAGALSVNNGAQVETTPEWDAGTNTATWSIINNPVSSPDCVEYTATLAGSVRDAATYNNSLTGDYVWEFTPGPCVVSVSPTHQSSADPVNYTKNIAITFNEQIIVDNWNTQVTVTLGGPELTITDVTVNNNVINIVLDGVLAISTGYRVTVDKSVENQTNNPLDINFNYIITTGRFIDNMDGTILDPSQNLTWMKCSQGQTWSGVETNTCTGTLGTFQFCNELDNDCNGGINVEFLQEPIDNGVSSAYNTCNDLIFAGKNNWRVPTRDEITYIVYCSNGTPTPLSFGTECGAGATSPVVDQNIFPNTGGSYYWTSRSYLVYAANWITFSNGWSSGTYSSNNKTNSYYIRCVADGL